MSVLEIPKVTDLIFTLHASLQASGVVDLQVHSHINYHELCKASTATRKLQYPDRNRRGDGERQEQFHSARDRPRRRRGRRRPLLKFGRPFPTPTTGIYKSNSFCAPATKLVQAYSFSAHGHQFTLIDSPGFDDTDVDDEEIFTALVEWLEQSYRKGQRLTGLLYLHRIIDNREKGSDLRNLRMFKKLCGAGNFANIILGTTWWDQEEADIARAREKVLKETPEFWGDMVAKGSRVERISLERQQCVDLLLSLATNDETTLRVQHEMVVENKAASETSAASEIDHYTAMRAIRDAEELELAAQRIRHEARLRMLEEKRKAEQERQFKEVQAMQAAEQELLERQRKKHLEDERRRMQVQKQRTAELMQQIKDLEIMRENLKQERLRLDRENGRRLEDLARAKITRRTDAHRNSLTAQETLLNKCVASGRSKQKVKYINLKLGPGLHRSFCDHCLVQLPLPQGFFRKSQAGC